VFTPRASIWWKTVVSRRLLPSYMSNIIYMAHVVIHVSRTRLAEIGGMDVVVVVLVKGVVGEVHEGLRAVLLGRPTIGLRGEARHPLLVDVDGERVHRLDHHVHLQ